MQQEIQDLVQHYGEAEQKGDVAALQQLLADDFMCVGPLGFQLTKAQTLARFT
ncbi:uncharacterized protein DUF4440 [Thermosporothrix hazakensis]|jgi:ketosteroid isomerase-like protein|uniref:Uncharacterized protein DUF4440 n=2 Tax=Thermosporothrix TaxID=768650 RepID=A0A326U4K7_THEHA|nr:nuclear transport factor 2 family protein [Thermosporothrix hazakensis]PZW27962.1 uncharacterized protein DUF4440 [Thermosporothrix hazakensis]BBH86892.1 hypothetical protein KTC_16430 [Thermosporothrix sp. COM3]GCE51185.1 hypothetical protein KTH_60540 [Thermosporothrix hazakensis]